MDKALQMLFKMVPAALGKLFADGDPRRTELQPKQPEDQEEGPSFCRFVDLPPELRELVYGHIFLEDQVISINPYKLPWKHDSALTRTCRLVRNEAIGSFYTNSVFHVRMDCTYDRGRLFRWLKMIGADSELVRRVSITQLAMRRVTVIDIELVKGENVDIVVRKIRGELDRDQLKADMSRLKAVVETILRSNGGSLKAGHWVVVYDLIAKLTKHSWC